MLGSARRPGRYFTTTPRSWIDLGAADNDGQTALQLAEASHDSKSDLAVLLKDATNKEERVARGTRQGKRRDGGR